MARKFLRRLPARLLGTLLLLSLFGSVPTASLALGNEKPQPDATVNGCRTQLPAVRWLGQGPGDFTLAEGDETFIVKRLPFAFFLEPGEVNAEGQLVYHAANKERVWACAGECDLPAVYHAAYEIGDFGPGWALSLVVIDDDIDDRLNYWAENDPAVSYLIVQEQAMVEYLRLVVPRQATWFYYAVDSIGVVAMCAEQTTPTATLTTTPTLPDTPTPTLTATFTPPDTPTPTFTATATAVDTPSPTATATLAPTPTDTPTATATPVPPEPPEPPTALDPTEEPAVQSWIIYLPLLAYEPEPAQ